MGHNATSLKNKLQRVSNELQPDMEHLAKLDGQAVEDLRWALIFIEKCIVALQRRRKTLY